MKKLLFLSIFAVVTAISWVACSKEEVKAPTNSINENIEAKFKFAKEVTLFDKNNESSVVIKVVATEQAKLDAYSAQNFELIAIPLGKTIAEIMPSSGGKDLEGDVAPSADENQEAEVGFQIVSKNLAKGVQSCAITFKQPDTGERADWSFYYHYSTPGVDHTGCVYRSSFLHRIWRWVAYKSTSTSTSYVEFITEDFVPNGDTECEYKDPCHQMRIKVKARSQGHYTVTFE